MCSVAFSEKKIEAAIREIVGPAFDQLAEQIN